MQNWNNHESRQLNVPPTDLDQAIVRLLIVLIVLAISVYGAYLRSEYPLSQVSYIRITITYLAASVIIFLVWRKIDRSEPSQTRVRTSLRFFCLLSDVTALSLFTALSQDIALVLLPVYLTAIIGYGFRFGTNYLYVTLIASVIGVTSASLFNSKLFHDPIILFTYYISMFFVPLYAAALLKKYKKVLLLLEFETAQRSQFINTMSHEFRTPLGSLLILIESIRDSIEREEEGSHVEDIQSDLKVAARCTERLLSLTNRILKTELDKPPPDVIAKELQNSFRDVLVAINICGVLANRKRIPIHWHIDQEVPPWTNLPSDGLQEILINLLDNAIKHSNKGRVRMNLSLANNFDMRTLRIAVSNDGARAGYRFADDDSNNTLDMRSHVLRKNTGLGLEITKMQLRRVNGSLEQEWKGNVAKFTANIPLTTVSNSPPESKHWISLSLVSDHAITSAEISELMNARIFAPVYTSKEIDSNMRQIVQRQIVFLAADRIECFSLTASRIKEKSDTTVVVVAYGQAETLKDYKEVSNFEVPMNGEPQLSAARCFSEARTYDLSRKSFDLCDIRVLIVDDSDFARETLFRILSNAGAIVESVATLRAAISRTKNVRFDVIITDLHVGNENGFAFLEDYCSSAAARASVIVLSGDQSDITSARAKALGASQVLHKPVVVGDLFNEIWCAVHADGVRNPRSGSFILEGVSSIDADIAHDIILTCPTLDEFSALMDDLRHEVYEMTMKVLSDVRINNIESAKRCMHQLQGVLYTAGASGIANLVRRLNEIIEVGDLDAEVQDLRRMDDYLENFISYLRVSYMQNNSSH